MIKKLSQSKIGKNLVKLKYDDIENIYILENRLKNPPDINKKYIYTIEKSKDFDSINFQFNKIVLKLKNDINNPIKKLKWSKYKVSTFYK